MPNIKQGMGENEKMKDTCYVLNELEKGEESAREHGWFTINDVLQDLGYSKK